MNLYTASLVLHIAAGSVALLTFWIAGVMKKGTPLHRRVGQIYLLAMLGVIGTGVPLVLGLIERGQSVGALFLTYLLVLVGNACWSAWRAIRLRRDRSGYFNGMYWTVSALTAASGAAIIALGIDAGAVLLQVFGGVGLLAAVGAWRSWKRAPNDPKWWLKEHYGAMIGNGVATHIAFFGIGLRSALPFVDPQLLQLFAWFTPLAGSLFAAWWLNRKYGGSTRRAAVQTSPSVSQPSPVPR